MMKHALTIAALAAITWSEPARAVVFDAFDSSRTFKLDLMLSETPLILFNADGTPVGRNSTGGLSGFITLGKRPGPIDPRRPEGNLVDALIAEITFEDILDFDLLLDLPLDTDGTKAKVPVTPALGGIDIFGGTLTTDGTDLFLDASGLPDGNPLLQITRDRFPEVLEFPNGQRYGDDVSDLLLSQLTKGSVNLLTASLPDGIAAPPGVVGRGEITADDFLVLASVSRDDPVPAVPLPAGLLLSLSALAGLAMFRRRR